MKSKIIFVPLKSKIQLQEKVYEEIRKKNKELKEQGTINNIFITSDFYYLLLFIKYIIEEHKLDYSKVIEGNMEDVLPYLEDNYKGSVNYRYIKALIDMKLYDLIRLFAYQDIEVKAYVDRVLDAFIEKDKKYLVVSNYAMPYIIQENIDVFEENNYNVISRDTPRIFNSKLIDKIREIKRDYYHDWKDVDLGKYDSIILLNDGNNEPISYQEVTRKYRIRFIKTFDIFNYNNISNFKSIEKNLTKNQLARYLNSVYIDKDKAYITYERKDLDLDSKSISIKELSNVSNEDLKHVIDSNEEIKDICLYVSAGDIIDNNFRIGFSTYNKQDNNDKKKAILRMVDVNKELTNRLRIVEEEIAQKIDELIVK